MKVRDLGGVEDPPCSTCCPPSPTQDHCGCSPSSSSLSCLHSRAVLNTEDPPPSCVGWGCVCVHTRHVPQHVCVCVTERSSQEVQMFRAAVPPPHLCFLTHPALSPPSYLPYISAMPTVCTLPPPLSPSSSLTSLIASICCLAGWRRGGGPWPLMQGVTWRPDWRKMSKDCSSG